MLYMWLEKFLKTEPSERLSRALRHNVRFSDLNEAFFERADVMSGMFLEL